MRGLAEFAVPTAVIHDASLQIRGITESPVCKKYASPPANAILAFVAWRLKPTAWANAPTLRLCGRVGGSISKALPF